MLKKSFDNWCFLRTIYKFKEDLILNA